MWGVGETIGRFKVSRLVKGVHDTQLVDGWIETIPTRMQVDDYPKERVITRDNATVAVDSVVYYRLTDPAKAIYSVQDYVSALQKLIQSALRDECGKYELDELLISRDAINTRLRTAIDAATEPWGISVERVEIMDIDLGEFGQILAEQRAAETRRRTEITEAEGKKRAAILRSEGEAESLITSAKGAKESLVLRAEAEKQAAILKAEADAEANLKRREAEARGYMMLKQVLDDSPESKRLIEVMRIQKAAELGESLGQSPSTKIVLPADIDNLLGLIRRIPAA
jgi:regulator of protease activity HflC (stomatin/prohibitin superfamily)